MQYLRHNEKIHFSKGSAKIRGTVCVKKVIIYGKKGNNFVAINPLS